MRRVSLVRKLGWRWLTLGLVLALVAGVYAMVPGTEHLLAPQADGQVATLAQPCGDATVAPAASAATLVPRQAGQLRVANWNLHKAADRGWQQDLLRFAQENDVLIIQEAVLTPEVTAVLLRGGMQWRMAGAFAFDGIERGVLVAATAAPLAACTLRAFEPLFPLPKSALVVRYQLGGAGAAAQLAVANLHSVNFTLGMARFRAQIEAVGAELAAHRGPIVMAGDFNTWSDERVKVMEDVAKGLGLTEAVPQPDVRRRAFGFALDHVYVRGFAAIAATSTPVKSSDHNPVLITLTGP